jgi:ubiquitin carboxyl-terminal hydrolase L3
MTQRPVKQFLPLESNPEVFTHLVHTLGVTPSIEIQDIFSLSEPELLAMVSRPAYALILTFPVSKTYDEDMKRENAQMEKYNGKGEQENVVWFQQTINNACGLHALLHSACNGPCREYIGESLLSSVVVHSLLCVHSFYSTMIQQLRPRQ